MPKTYRVIMHWEMTDVVEVEAESEDEAIEIADSLPLTSGSYVDGSWDVDEVIELDEEGNEIYE